MNLTEGIDVGLATLLMGVGIVYLALGGKTIYSIANTEERNPSEKAGGRQELTASSEEEKHPRELSNPGPDAEGVNTPKNTRETKDRPAQEAASSDSVAKSHNSPGFFGRVGRAIGRGAGRAKNLLWG